MRASYRWWVVIRENSPQKKVRNWSVGLGVLLIILGILAISAPYMATMAVVFITGWLLLFAGVEQIVYAVRRHEQGGLITRLLLAALYIVAGGMLLRRPVTAAIAVTAIVAILLIIDGVLEIALAIRLRKTLAAGWLAMGGVLSLILGIIAWRGLPRTSFFLIGVVVGIRLIFKGIEHIRLADYGPDIDEQDKWTQRAA